jgi:hypothetical protein
MQDRSGRLLGLLLDVLCGMLYGETAVDKHSEYLLSDASACFNIGERC